MPKTDSTCRIVENALFRDDLSGLQALPDTLYIGLCRQSEPATKAGSGGEYPTSGPASWDTYTRAAIARSVAAMGALNTIPANVASPSFAAPSAGNPAVEAAGSYLIFDAPTGGTARFWGTLVNPVTPTPGGSSLTIGAGKFTHEER